MCKGYPSNPFIIANGSPSFSSFDLTITHDGDHRCVTHYQLVVTRVEDGATIYNGRFQKSLTENGTFDFKRINPYVNILTCKYTYTFQISSVGGFQAATVADGIPNLNGRSLIW